MISAFDKRSRIPTAVLAAGAVVSALVAGAPARPEETIPLWGRWERAYEAKSDAPPEDLELFVDLTGPGGGKITARGFWDGGRMWKVRFLAVKEGTWRARSRSRPPLTGLDGIEDSFRVARTENPRTRFERHGRVEVGIDGRRFRHADGTPFFWLVDTAWNGALLSTREEWETYCERRARMGFTGVQFVATHWRTAPANLEGLRAYEGRDPIRIRPEFFRRIDERVETLNRHGLLAAIVCLWTLGREELSPGRLPEAQAIRLARYITARYSGHHVAWFLGGDGNYLAERAERWKRIGRAVFDPPSKAPVFLHPQGMQWPYDAFLEERWLTALGYQSGHGDSDATLRWLHSGPPATKWREGPPRPTVNLEPPYEDLIAYQSRRRHTAYTVRRAVWWSCLVAPTAGSSYGAHGIWSWEREEREPRDHRGTGTAKPWHVALAFDGGRQVGRLARFFNSIAWWRLYPDRSLVLEAQAGVRGVEPRLQHVVYTRSRSGCAALYVDGERVAGLRIAGDFSNWDPEMRLALANELTGDRPWAGVYRCVAIYSRALGEDEIARNRRAGRVTDPEACIALYTFEESGPTIRNRGSGGGALDLEIESEGGVERLPEGGLRVRNARAIATARPARVLVEAARRSGELTIEAWIAPSGRDAAGPARVVTLSADTSRRNFTLGQEQAAWDVRVRTTETNDNGIPSLRWPENAGAGDFVAAARSEAGDLAVLYLPLGGSVRLREDRLEEGLTAEWFDPRSGARQAAARSAAGRWEAPDARDWVLLFRSP